MLLKLSQDQFTVLQSKLERSGISMNQRQWSTHAENRTFYSILDSMGMPDSRSNGKRAAEPNYEELGFDRVAGSPTDAEIQRYAQITNGAELTKKGLVAQGLLFDSDLITDRYSVATLNLLVDLYNKYLGRGNDFNHSFDARQARSRIIETHMGTDPGTVLHPDTPVDALRQFSPMNPNSGVYTALFATLAFPNMENETGGAFAADSTINSVKSGLIHDISIAFQQAQNATYCSICLDPMESFWFWTYCEEHGFPGGRTDSGQAVVAIMDHASDVFTFGLVSDGAVPRAGIILDPFIQNQEATAQESVDNSVANQEIPMYMREPYRGIIPVS